MKKFPGIIVVALALISFPAFAADKPVVKIGLTVPLTGDNAQIGDAMKGGATLAREDMKTDTKYDYQLVFEDDGMEAKRTAATTGKLINVDKVDAIVSISSGTGGVVSPIAETSKVIHFGLASAQSVADGDYNFIHWTPPSEEARTLVATLEKKGIKTVAMLGLNQQGFLAIRDEILKQIEGKDIKVTSDQTINPGEKDFRTAIAKAKADNPDIYIVTFFSPEIEILTKQMREAGIKDNITAIEAFGLSTEPSLFNGLWYVDAALAESNFTEKYTKRFSRAPGFGSPNAYDVFNMLVAAYEAAGTDPNVKPSREDVLKKLHELKDFDGVLGNLTVDEKGVVLSPAAVILIQDGKPVPAPAE